MCTNDNGPRGHMIGINPHRGTSRGFNWGGGGPGTITGRNHTHNQGTNPMCILGNNGHPHASNRAWYEKQVRIGQRRGWFNLDRIVGHMFANVLRGRATLREWWTYETTLTAHTPDCRYRRLAERLLPPMNHGDSHA